MGTVPHPASSALDMFDRGYSFVNAGSDVSRPRDSSLADVRAFRPVHRVQASVAYGIASGDPTLCSPEAGQRIAENIVSTAADFVVAFRAACNAQQKGRP
jgi:hypothetical protein